MEVVLRATHHDDELVSAIKYGTSIHLPVLSHEFPRLALVCHRTKTPARQSFRSGVRDPGSRKGGKPLTGPRIIELGELGLEEVFEMVRLDLLQAHDVCPVTDELCANSM